MTKIEILHETANFYNLSNRSVKEDGSVCLYVGPDNKQCAFARCCINPIPEWDKILGDQMGTSVRYVVRNHTDGNVDNLLKPEYHGHDVVFWCDVQELHDFDPNWNEDGLSERGREEYYKLLNKYAND
jgi:hypothetical protein